MYRVRILVDGFVMGTTAYSRGNEISVSLPIYNYLTAERKVELVEEDIDTSPEPYHRRDMQAETARTAQAAAPPPPPRPRAKAKRKAKPKA